MSTVIICLVLAVICVYSIISYRKKISSGCCGSGGGEIKIKPKDTNTKNYPYEYYAGVDGMTCAHCKMRVENAFNGIDGVYARADLKKKTAHILSKCSLNENLIKSTVEKAGYTYFPIKK